MRGRYIIIEHCLSTSHAASCCDLGCSSESHSIISATLGAADAPTFHVGTQARKVAGHAVLTPHATPRLRSNPASPDPHPPQAACFSGNQTLNIRKYSHPLAFHTGFGFPSRQKGGKLNLKVEHTSHVGKHRASEPQAAGA